MSYPPEFTATSYPIRLYLVRTAAEFHRVCKDYGQRYTKPRAPRASMVQVVPGAYMIVIGSAFAKCTPAEKAGILAHEATHVWQHLADYTSSGPHEWEANAYTVQAIVEWAWKIVVDGAVN